MHRLQVVLVVSIVIIGCVRLTSTQTEGDIGYDYTFEDSDYDTMTELGKDPTFDTPLANVSVNVGETALLPCYIDYLGKYKVAWLESVVPLTYEDRRVIDDSRFSIVRPDVRDWNLQIQDVRLEDGGHYRCTVNTKPVSSKSILLQVTVPVSIIDRQSSGDVTIQEGTDVTITCSVYGIPTPEVTWYRRSRPGRRADEDTAKCVVFSGSPSSEWEGRADSTWSLASSSTVFAGNEQLALARGTSLTFRNTSRHCDDIYECIASNGVRQRPATRRIRLTVAFHPLITLPNRRIGQTLGHETVLECTITAYPQATNYWEKDNRRISSSNRHKIDAFDELDYTWTLSLSISDLERSDYGFYHCVAANAFGQDNKTMLLFVASRGSLVMNANQSPPKTQARALTMIVVSLMISLN